MDRTSYLSLLPIEVRRIVERHFWWLDKQNHTCCRGEDIIEAPEERSILRKIAAFITIGDEEDCRRQQARLISNMRCEGVIAPACVYPPLQAVHKHDALREYLIKVQK